MKYSCCYFIILGFFQSFYSNFISFFGTNLLTQCLVPSASCFFCLFFYIAGNQYQRESKHRETPRRFFMDQKTPDGPKQHLGGAPRGAPPTRTRQAPQVASRTPSLHYKFPNIPKPIGVNRDQKFHCCKVSISAKTNLDPVPAPCRRGNYLRWPFSSSRRPPR